MPWCEHSGACRCFGAVNRRFRPPPARAARDLLLPKLIRGAIVVSKPPGIWQMSALLSWRISTVTVPVQTLARRASLETRAWRSSIQRSRSVS
jgi:hypothetical protein